MAGCTLPWMRPKPNAVPFAGREALRSSWTSSQVSRRWRWTSRGRKSNRCYDLTKAYSSYYQDHPILTADSEEDRNLRLVLTERFTRCLNLGMGLLGIALPERM